jgi:hypothetical protein
MKKLISVLFIVGFCFALTSTNAQTASSHAKASVKKLLHLFMVHGNQSITKSFL